MTAAHIPARLDHVATAVPDVDAADAHWRGTVGAGLVGREHNDVFRTAQVGFAGGGKLELIGPSPEAGGTSFMDGFLDRFGPRIHHVTLKVDDLPAALDTVRDGGYEVVDVQLTDPHWREGFLRPSQVGGLIVQVAWASEDDAGWAARSGVTPTPPADTAPRLLGPTVAHPDPASARAMWRLLGAEVVGDDERFTCTWPDSALDVGVVAGGRPGPVGLRFAGDVPRPAAGGPPVPDVLAR